jgi:hypothetical protein
MMESGQEVVLIWLKVPTWKPATIIGSEAASQIALSIGCSGEERKAAEMK